MYLSLIYSDFVDIMSDEFQVSVRTSFSLNEFARLIWIIVESEPEFRRKLVAVGKNLTRAQHDRQESRDKI